MPPELVDARRHVLRAARVNGVRVALVHGEVAVDHPRDGKPTWRVELATDGPHRPEPVCRLRLATSDGRALFGNAVLITASEGQLVFGGVDALLELVA